MSNTPDMQAAFVPKFYEMDPEVDDLVPDGTYLRDGMIVLLEDDLLRGNEDRAGDKWERRHLLEVNRWCEVTHLKVTPRYDGGHLVEFIGVYPDGTKRKRTYAAAYAWLVRRFSIPADEAAS